MVHPVQGGHALPWQGASHDDRRGAAWPGGPELVIVKGVQWLPKLQHHIVGDVHHIVDGALARQGEQALHPKRRGPNMQITDEGRAIARA